MSSDEVWRITDHACAACLGRVLARNAADGQCIARCADCGHEAAGGAEAICACGALPDGFKIRLKCQRQAQPSPDFPAEIIAAEAAP